MIQQNSVLDHGYHARLISALDDICAQAQIPKRFIHESASTYCTPAQVAWLQHIHHSAAKSGVVLTNTHNPVEVAAAMTAALLRNYIDCRMRTLHQIINADTEDVTVLAIPNFFLTSENAGHIAKWETSPVLEWLQDRWSRDRKNILYVENMEQLKIQYGLAVHDFLRANYVILGERF